MTQYFDGPGFPAAEHSKAQDTSNISRMEMERNNLIYQIDELKTQRNRMGEDLKRANTDLLQYKDRTQALQKQITGLKSGRYKPDQVPEFKTHNPNQQIIKALLSENEDLNKRIELLKEIKEKVTTNAANKDQSELFDALTYLEEENKNLRSQLNLGEGSPHSNENESAEIAQLREKLRMSMDLSRDLSDQLESVNKAIVADKVSSTPRPMVSKGNSDMLPRTPVMPPYPQPMPIVRPPGPMRDMPAYSPYLRTDFYRPQAYINTPPIPPPTIMPPGPGPMRPQDDPRLRVPPMYKQQDPFGYK